MSLLNIMNKKINNNELTIEEGLMQEKIQKLPFIVDYGIGKDVPINNVDIYYYPNLETYSIDIRFEDNIAGLSKLKKVIVNKEGEVIDTIIY